MSGTKRRYEQLQPQLQRDIVHDYRHGVRGHGCICYRPEASASRSNSSICDRARRTCRWEPSRAARSQEEEAEQRRAGEVVQ